MDAKLLTMLKRHRKQLLLTSKQSDPCEDRQRRIGRALRPSGLAVFLQHVCWWLLTV